MSSILIVDDEETLSRRVWSGDGKPRREVTSWREFPTRVREVAPGDVVVLNLEARNAPTLREAVKLRRAQPDLDFVYVMEVSESAPQRTLDVLAQPGVHWVDSRASDAEFALRLRSFANSIKKTRPKAASPRSSWERLMPDLHNPVSGRLDAARIAEWFGMPLKSLAGSLGRGYATVHKTPDAAALQDRLAIFLRIASALSRLAGSREGAKAWLNAPNPDLEDNRTPLSAIESGEQAIIAELLEDALHGQPG